VILASSCAGEPAPTPEPPGGTLALGTLSVLAGSPSCPAGQRCTLEVEVSCPDLEQAARTQLLVFSPGADARGTVVILLGGRGGELNGVTRPFMQTLVQDGLQVVVVSWEDAWLTAGSGEEVGPVGLGCRPATTIAWVHDNLYREIGEPEAGLGGCGFCLTGNSGGASQIGYALSFYGLNDMVDAAVLSGGPPHAAIDKGCLGEPNYAYDVPSSRIIDESWGFIGGGGPCELHDRSYLERWRAGSLEHGGDYEFRRTRVAFVFVEGDPTVGPAHGMDYLAQLQEASPFVSHRTIGGDNHTIQLLPQGRAALEDALLAKVQQ
jgi:hypothetical protein